MSGSIRILSFLVLLFGVVGGVLLSNYVVGTRSRPMPDRSEPVPPASIIDLQNTFTDVSNYVMPSVVHITTKTVVSDRFGWQLVRRRVVSGTGSGVIVDAQGHIVTNHHVIRGAKDVVVKFTDGRKFQATVIGVDSSTDLAVLKIDPPKDIQPAVLADSDEIRVGQWVLAVGSPFGLEHTVTAGIVSAVGRRLSQEDARDFIQTDAAINPGNSGGALVDLQGKIVGINTMIVANEDRKSSSGVGFAISSNVVKWMTSSLIKHGRAIRGYIGIGALDVNEDLIRTMRYNGISYASLNELLKTYNLRTPKGIFVLNVDKGFAADKAGIQPEDLIISLNGEEIKNGSHFRFLVVNTLPGTSVTLLVATKEGTQKTVNAVITMPPQ